MYRASAVGFFVMAVSSRQRRTSPVKGTIQIPTDILNVSIYRITMVTRSFNRISTYEIGHFVDESLWVFDFDCADLITS